MIIYVDDLLRFHKKFPHIATVDVPLKDKTISQEFLLNPKLHESVCDYLIEKYGIFACCNRWLLTDEILSSYSSFVICISKAESKYQISNGKQYFDKLFKSHNRVFDSLDSFDSHISENSIGTTISKEFTPVTYSELLCVLKKQGGYIMPNIEDSIMKAMQELGIDLDDQPATQKKSTKDAEVEDSVNSTEDFVEEEQQPEEDTQQPEPNQPVYAKIKDGVMVLIFGADTVFQEKNLSGMPMKVLSFELPDLSVESLQELKLIEEEQQPEKKVEKKPEKKSKANRTPVVTDMDERDVPDSDSSEIEELRKRKATLDAEIKDARADGNIDLVNLLRKQRRAVRNRINSLEG